MFPRQENKINVFNLTQRRPQAKQNTQSLFFFFTSSHFSLLFSMLSQQPNKAKQNNTPTQKTSQYFEIANAKNKKDEELM